MALRKEWFVVQIQEQTSDKERDQEKGVCGMGLIEMKGKSWEEFLNRGGGENLGVGSGIKASRNLGRGGDREIA